MRTRPSRLPVAIECHDRPQAGAQATEVTAYVVSLGSADASGAAFSVGCDDTNKVNRLVGRWAAESCSICSFENELELQYTSEYELNNSPSLDRSHRILRQSIHPSIDPYTTTGTIRRPPLCYPNLVCLTRTQHFDFATAGGPERLTTQMRLRA